MAGSKDSAGRGRVAGLRGLSAEGQAGQVDTPLNTPVSHTHLEARFLQLESQNGIRRKLTCVRSLRELGMKPISCLSPVQSPAPMSLWVTH